MSGVLTGLRRSLRDSDIARAAVVRLATIGRQPARRAGVLFLNYHDMRPGERAAFAAQLRALRNLGDLVGVTDAVQALASTRDRDLRICLTFDDGCTGAYRNALPILAEQEVPATFFVVPSWMDGPLEGRFGWPECRSLLASGMEVGSHSSSHLRLLELSGADALAELSHSRLRIEAELGRNCLHFACPWGQPGSDYRDQRDPRLAEAAGYHSFFTTIQRHAAPGSDPFCLPRVRMEPSWGAAELRYALLR